VDGLEKGESSVGLGSGARETGVSEMTGSAAVGGAHRKWSDGAQAAEYLMKLAEGVGLFRARDGRIHARVAFGGRHEIFGLRSSAFRDWLVDGYVRARQKLPPERAVDRVVEAVQARARFAVETAPLEVRVGCDVSEVGSGYYIDLGDTTGRAIKIGGSGWSLVEEPGAHFRRPNGQLPLPVPSPEGSIELLRPFVNVVESEFRLLVGWMAAALRPPGPYPVLAIHGEQGSAKSTLARVVRQLIDPQAGALLAQPRGTHDLMVTAVNGWLLAYDNVSTLPTWLSDSFCRLATGGGLAIRAFYSDEDRKVLYSSRPIILNGIEDFVRKGDLVDRCVSLHLPAIGPEGRREESEFWNAFHETQPRIFSGLLNAIAGGLRTLPTVHVAALPRMADFARFGEAVGRGLGWPEGEFLAAYAENRREATTSAIEASVLATTILRVTRSIGFKEWTDSATRWVDQLSRDAGSKARRTLMPKTPTALGSELRRLAPALREHGVSVTFNRTPDARTITLKRLPKVPAGEAKS
jgi:hypothetical protein